MKILDHFFAPSLGFPGEMRHFIKVDFDERGGSPADKMRAIRSMIADGAADPRIGELASSIVNNVGPRDDKAEAAALLAWVQENVRYTEEGTETFRSAAYTAEHGYADCDDMTILLGALLESIGIPTKVVVISKRVGLFRHEPLHVFLRSGHPHRAPREWIPLEPTLPVSFGWDPEIYALAHADAL